MERGMTQGTGSRQVYKADGISEQQVILESSAPAIQPTTQPIWWAETLLLQIKVLLIHSSLGKYSSRCEVND